MRVVISGGGVAGLTLAAKLSQQGREPIVIEKAESYDQVGYAIGLWPLGSCVLHGLACYDELVEQSCRPDFYEFGDHQGRTCSAWRSTRSPPELAHRSCRSPAPISSRS